MSIDVNPRTPTRFYDDVTATAEALGVDVTAALAPISAEIQRRAALREAKANALDAKTVREQILAADPADVPALIVRLAEERAKADAIQEIVAGAGNLGLVLDDRIARASVTVHEDVLAAFVPTFAKASKAVEKAVSSAPESVDLFDPASVLAAGAEKAHRELTEPLSVMERIAALARHGSREYPAFACVVEVPQGTVMERVTNDGRVPRGESPLPAETKALNEQVAGVARAGGFSRQVVAAVREGFGLSLATNEAELQKRTEAVTRATTVQRVDPMGPTGRSVR